MKVRRILVCGYYGFANTGDEAILAVLLGDLQGTNPGATIVVMAGSPEAVIGEHGVDSFHWQDVVRLAEEAERADVMVLGGGGLFQDHSGFDPDDILTTRHGTIGYYAGFALLAGMTSTPLIIYGVGVGPLSSADGRRYTRLAFARASAATVRDDTSLALLSDIGVDTSRVRVTADPVWTLEPASVGIADQILHLERIHQTGLCTIAVAVRPWGAGEWAAELAAALDRLVCLRDADILFVPFQQSPNRHENDALAALEVARRMERIDRSSILRGDYTPAERMAIIGSCDLTIGMRLHSVVFAANVGVPVMALSYDRKVEVAMQQLGLGSQVVDLSVLSADVIVETATHAKAAAGATISRLRANAESNRACLVDVPPPPSADQETIGAYGYLTVGRVHNQRARLETEMSKLRSEVSSLGSELASLHDEHRGLEIAHRQVQIQRDETERRSQAILDSRTVRLASRLWRLHASLRSWRRALAETVAAAPESMPDAIGAPIVADDRSKGSASTDQSTRRPRGGDPVVRRRIEAQLRRVLEEHADVAGIVVYPPSIGWNVTLFQRPQQMALAFARLGYLVFYGLDDSSPESDVGLQLVSPRIYLTKLPLGEIDLLELIPQPIAVSYIYNFGWTKQLKDPRVIFEHIDELEVFEAAYEIGMLRNWFEEAITGADLVAASARTLLGKMRERRPDAVLCPNGVDYGFFSDFSRDAPPADIAELMGRPIIGYYGAIAEWLDFTLIRTTAAALPDCELVFIGPLYGDSMSAHLEVFDLPNVHWLGAKAYRDLPAYLRAFDVATIPFVVNEVTDAVSPVKLFEYMAGGRPVVTPRLQECTRYEAVLVSTDQNDYIAKLRKAMDLRHDPEHQALLRRIARANTWDIRAGTLIDALAVAKIHRVERCPPFGKNPKSAFTDVRTTNPRSVVPPVS